MDHARFVGRVLKKYGVTDRVREAFELHARICADNGGYARNNTDFIAEIEKRGFMRKKKKSGMWVQGMQDVYINTRTGKILKKFSIERVIRRHAHPAPSFDGG